MARFSSTGRNSFFSCESGVDDSIKGTGMGSALNSSFAADILASLLFSKSEPPRVAHLSIVCIITFCFNGLERYSYSR
jgi:hypothetical protein